MISKMTPYQPDAAPEDRGGSRIGIVFNGSPLFTGDAGSGESNIRRWIIENDWLEAVVALPDQLFYNTGISTYIWFVTNRKEERRRGKVQLIDGRTFFVKMPKSLGDKRNRIGGTYDGEPNHIAELTQLYENFQNDETRTVTLDGEQKGRVVSKVFDNEAFGFRKVTIERPLKLAFRIDADALERLGESTPFLNLAKSKKRKDKAAKTAEEAAGRELQNALIDLLVALDEDHGHEPWMDRAAFVKDLKAAAKARDLKLLKGHQTMIVKAIGQPDENAAA